MIAGLDHFRQKAADDVAAIVGQAFDRHVDAAGLAGGEAFEEGTSLVRGVKQALAPVGFAGHLFDIAIIDELPEHAGETLFSDFEDIEQIRDGHAGP